MQIWNMRLNEYLRYWSLKALKSVSVILYKLLMSSKTSRSFSEFMSVINSETEDDVAWL